MIGWAVGTAAALSAGVLAVLHWATLEDRLGAGEVFEEAGLAGSQGGRLCGVVQGFVMVLASTDDLPRRRTVRLRRPANAALDQLPSLVRDVEQRLRHLQFDPRPDPEDTPHFDDAWAHRPAVAALLEGLRGIQWSGTLTCPAVHVQALCTLLPWAARQLGWPSPGEDAAWRSLIDDPDPVVRQRAWLHVLGGWSSIPPKSDELTALAHAAALDEDVWVRAACLPHLGPAAASAMRAFVADVSHPDALVRQVMTSAEATYPASVGVSLLHTQRADRVQLGAELLQQVGRPQDLPALHRALAGLPWWHRRGAAGHAVREAVAVIESRAAPHARTAG